jgi:hypothetical protein
VHLDFPVNPANITHMGNDNKTEPAAGELLELDLDLRMHEVVLSAVAITEWDTQTALKYLRYAFGAGYLDATTEAVPNSLYLNHGYPIPDRSIPNDDSQPELTSR